MKEYVVCDMCTATVLSEGISCDFCGNDFKNNGSSAEILRFKDEIDRKIYTTDLFELLNNINKSKYKDHPIILFRKAKVLLINYMANDGVIEAGEFCEVFHIVNSISKISEDYWTEFITYFSVLFPTSHTKLFLEDFKAIQSFLNSINRDEDKQIEDKLIQQMFISELDETFFKQFKFYTNSKNFINDNDFINNQKYVLNKYNEYLNKLKNTI